MYPRIAGPKLLALMVGAVCMAGASRVVAEEPGPPAKAAEYRNLIAIKGGYTYIINQSQETTPGEEPPPSFDQMGGCVLTYEREIIPGWLVLEVSKPFYVRKGRFDSPLEVLAKYVHQLRLVELYVGLGLTVNARVFSREREDQEGRKVAWTLGLTSNTGVLITMSPRTRMDVEFGYVRNLYGAVALHDLVVNVGPAIVF